MRFTKKNLIKRYGIPIRIYQGNQFDDGGMDDQGQYIPANTNDQPYIDDVEPVIPADNSNSSDTLITDDSGQSINFSFEWYSKHRVQVGTIIKLKNDDDETRWQRLIVIGPDRYNQLADICMYYLKDSSQEANNDDPDL
ncbi:hypothetical protein EFP95_01345 [Lentilactobacillus hilgardii]|nr:hypothetical protein [Lentilactobacillus hilgardii]